MDIFLTPSIRKIVDDLDRISELLKIEKKTLYDEKNNWDFLSTMRKKYELKNHPELNSYMLKQNLLKAQKIWYAALLIKYTIHQLLFILTPEKKSSEEKIEIKEEKQKLSLEYKLLDPAYKLNSQYFYPFKGEHARDNSAWLY